MRGLRHVHGETNPVQIMASALDLVDRQIRILRQSGFGRTVMVALFREKVWRERMGV
jgi:Tfp pilus assembly PilM family ATPase